MKQIQKEKHSQIATFLILLSVPIFLSACSTASETFECQAGKGIGCQSISQVNKMVDTGKLEEKEDSETVKTMAPVFNKNGIDLDGKGEVDLSEIALSDQTLVNRVREEHLRVWIAPFQDEQGNLHEANIIHTVIRPGYWQLSPTV